MAVQKAVARWESATEAHPVAGKVEGEVGESWGEEAMEVAQLEVVVRVGQRKW